MPQMPKIKKPIIKYEKTSKIIPPALIIFQTLIFS